MAFGDTSGYCSAPGNQWRYNVLFRSQDDALADTVKVSNSPMWAPGISRQIINHFGGRLWVESEPGRGSVFSFTLPAMVVAGAEQRFAARAGQ